MSHGDLRQMSRVPDRGLLLASALAFAGFVMILVLVLLSATDPLDLAVASRVGLLRDETTSGFAVAITGLGSLTAVVLVAAVAITALWVQTRRLWASAILASSVTATASLVTLLKIVVGRPRPTVTTLIGGPARDFSFPSGHTTNGTLVYVLAALLLTARVRRALWRGIATGSAVVVALLIGLSRIYLGYHWATDVLAGWLLSTGVVTASYFTCRGLGVADDVDPAVGSIQTVPDHRVQPRHLV